MKKNENKNTGIQEEQNKALPENPVGNQTEGQPVFENENGSEKFSVVVCAYEGHEALLEEIWRKRYSGKVRFVTVEPGYALASLIAEMIADEQVADRFVLLQPDTVPCSEISSEELLVPVVYVTAEGEKKYDEKMPLVVDKAKVVPLVADDTLSSEDIVRRLLESGPRPLEVGFSFGNYVTPVRRGNPCEHIVIEALVRKKFIVASLEGFKAISHLLLKD